MSDRPPSLDEMRERLDRADAEAQNAVAESRWLRLKLHELRNRIHHDRQRENGIGRLS
jgi:hypothetical protein